MRGWSNPNRAVAPTITGLSTNKSIATLFTIVAIVGRNFRPYSSIRFGRFRPDIMFINSDRIEFYVPQIITKPATYTVQVFNGNNGSNIVTYQIDDALNFWIIDTEINKLKINDKSINGLEIDGDLLVSGKTQKIRITSDYRNIKDGTKEELNQNDTVDNLKPIKYYDKQTGSTEIGFIAHELQEVYPYLVTGNKDAIGYQSINYNGLIGLLVHEIQQLKAEVSTLKGV
jgi:hypothetical protein